MYKQGFFDYCVLHNIKNPLAIQGLMKVALGSDWLPAGVRQAINNAGNVFRNTPNESAPPSPEEVSPSPSVDFSEYNPVLGNPYDEQEDIDDINRSQYQKMVRKNIKELNRKTPSKYEFNPYNELYPHEAFEAGTGLVAGTDKLRTGSYIPTRDMGNMLSRFFTGANHPGR